MVCTRKSLWASIRRYMYSFCSRRTCAIHDLSELIFGKLSSQKTGLRDTKTYMSTSRWVIYRLESRVQCDESMMKPTWRHPISDHQVRSSCKPTRYYLRCRTGGGSSRWSPLSHKLCSGWSTLAARDDPRMLERPLNGSRPRISSSSSGICPSRGLKERIKIRES